MTDSDPGKIDRSRLIFPGLAGLYETFAPYGYAFMRFSAGAILLPHGVQKLIYGTATATAQGMAAKGFPFPLQLAYFVGFVELFVGAALAIGLFTRLAAAMLWIQMVVIIVWFVGPNGYFWGKQGYEFALLWLLLFTAIFFRGGGRYSIDHYLGKEF
jgi:putative oxidoreductase